MILCEPLDDEGLACERCGLEPLDPTQPDELVEGDDVVVCVDCLETSDDGDLGWADLVGLRDPRPVETVHTELL